MPDNSESDIHTQKYRWLPTFLIKSKKTLQQSLIKSKRFRIGDDYPPEIGVSGVEDVVKLHRDDFRRNTKNGAGFAGQPPISD